MANQGQVNRLKDITKWNQWRKAKPVFPVDLCRADLSKADLSEANLSGANLSGTDLRGADLRGFDLSGFDLSKVDLSETNLSGADLSGADLSGADLSGTDLSGADLSGANLGGANLSETDLSGLDLSRTNLSGTNLSEANLIGTNLSGANLSDFDLSGFDLSGFDLSGFDLSGADLSGFDLSGADLSGANLSGTDLRGANLSGTDLRGASLSGADLIGADLIGASLSGANLSGTDLSGFDLSGFDLSEANLCEANLSKTQVLRTSFEKAEFTAACLEDWNINSATKFDGAICEYVYLKVNQQERRPREGTFKPGEFAALFQQAVDTIDLIFKDGIDWQAFFQSFQDLRSQYADQDLSIQAIEKKRDGAFVVRLEVSPEADKPAIESSAKELYETQLVLMEQRYRDVLNAKDGEIVAYKQQSANLMKITELLAARPPMTEAPKYDLRGAQFAGGFAENVQGDQIGGTINNYGASLDEITQLLSTLREQAQAFPIEHKDEALDILDDLEGDLAKPEPDQARIGRRLKKLVAIATLLTGLASGSAAVSGDLKTFTGNVIELTEKLGVPIEQVQPNQIPPATP